MLKVLQYRNFMSGNIGVVERLTYTEAQGNDKRYSSIETTCECYIFYIVKR